jgi:hypothetical protein
VRTIVYVDAFNLYYGCLRGSPYKWLDLVALCRVLLPKHRVECIRYFTARVGARPGAAGQPTRQQLYLRALETFKPIVEIYYGHYLSRRQDAAGEPSALQLPICGGHQDRGEGSDVNLATHLISDAYEGRLEAAVLISNDSDLLAPVQLVTRRLGKRVGILNPQVHPSKALNVIPRDRSHRLAHRGVGCTSPRFDRATNLCGVQATCNYTPQVSGVMTIDGVANGEQQTVSKRIRVNPCPPANDSTDTST